MKLKSLFVTGGAEVVADSNEFEFTTFAACKFGFIRISSTLAVLTLLPLTIANAQNGLRDIPDPAVDAQLSAFKLPEGAKINLFASDPMISKPVHMNWDREGRLWVVSSPLYPHIKPGQEENDKLVILEDTNGDGTADKATDFAKDLHIPTAVLPGDGGVYVANSTEMLFIRDTDGDGKGDHRQVMLSGFGTEDTHHLVHTFRWGPEGEIWLNQSIYIHTHLETPYGIRRLLGGGMWHFRPETRRAEVFMKGLVNPWGHAFDEFGQSFMTDGAGGDGINFVFPRSVFKTSPGATRVLSGLNPGQPKHCSLEVATGRHIPEDWQGTLIAPDFRGHRINRFKLTDNGSAYTSTQVEDLVSSSHRAFRPIDVKMGPDGAIYIADWYNPIIQHGEVDFRDPRRDHTHGRIWRITFEGRDLVKKPDIKNASVKELVAMLDAEEGWTREQAMVELRQRDADEVEKSLTAGDDEKSNLRKLWASQAINRANLELAERLLPSKNHKVRAAALRAIYYHAAENPNAFSIAEKLVTDSHPQVRLWAVSVLAQLKNPETVATALRALDGKVEVDEFLDFALWNICREHSDRWTAAADGGNPFDNTRQLLFAVRAINQPVAINQILSSLKKGELKSPKDIADVSDWIARVGKPTDLNALFEIALAEGAPPARQETVLRTLAEAGRLRKLQPAGDKNRLTQFLDSANGGIFSQAATLAGQWKLESARPKLQAAFSQADKNESRARAALEGLRVLGGPKTASFLDKIAANKEASFRLRSLAVIGRAKSNPKAGARIALPVLRDAPEGKDPHGIFDAFLGNKQGTVELATLLGQGDNPLPQEIALVGVQKASSAATRPQQLIKAIQKSAGLKPMKLALTADEMNAMMQQIAEKGNPHRGEKIYRRAALQCVVCHAIGGAGGVIGPDLVSIGSSAPVDYLVESLLEPSKKIKEGYHTTLVTLKNGDAFAGAIASEDDKELVVRDAAGKENRIPKSEIANNTISPVSLMPPGLTATLREDEFVDLVRFLSELGKDGDFKTPPNRFVRKWEVLMPHERTRDDIGHYGRKIFAEDFKTYQFMPLYADVSGAIPTEEMPKVVGRGKNRYGVGRFFVEVQSVGTIKLRVSGKLADMNLFIGEDEIKLPKEGSEITVELPVKKPGRQKITVSGLQGWGWDRVKIELLDDAGKVKLLSLADLGL